MHTFASLKGAFLNPKEFGVFGSLKAAADLKEEKL
jgi:hypothetical protein